MTEPVDTTGVSATDDRVKASIAARTVRTVTCEVLRDGDLATTRGDVAQWPRHHTPKTIYTLARSLRGRPGPARGVQTF